MRSSTGTSFSSSPPLHTSTSSRGAARPFSPCSNDGSARQQPRLLVGFRFFIHLDLDLGFSLEFWDGDHPPRACSTMTTGSSRGFTSCPFFAGLCDDLPTENDQFKRRLESKKQEGAAGNSRAASPTKVSAMTMAILIKAEATPRSAAVSTPRPDGLDISTIRLRTSYRRAGKGKKEKDKGTYRDDSRY